MLFKSVFVAAVALASGLLAHPGHDVAAEAFAHRKFLELNSNLHVKCGKHLEARGATQDAISRRHILAEGFRKERGLADVNTLRARDFASVLATDHHSNFTGIDFKTDPDILFSSTSSCLLQPETTEGPFYVTGEYIRKNMTENQPGIPIVVDIQVIDVNTCEPAPGLHVEVWHCNSTGTYGGVLSSDDPANINATWLRGIQRTDSNGVIQMATIFPGYYGGRTTHIHILTHENGTVLPNHTFVGGAISHTGQLFFDQDLISQVSAVEPYSSNTQSFSENANEGFMADEAAATDPVVEYVYAGSSVADGLITWITVGINSTMNKTVSVAASYGADGGVPT